MEEPSTSFEKFMTKHFPLTEDNGYGVIPLIGLAVSFYSSALFVYAVEYELDSFIWAAVWINPALLIFALLQAVWGFRVAHIKFLRLWLRAKVAEAVSSVSLTLVAWTGFFGNFHYWNSLQFPGIINTALVLFMIYIGFSKYRYLKQIEKKNLEVDAEHPLQDVK